MGDLVAAADESRRKPPEHADRCADCRCLQLHRPSSEPLRQRDDVRRPGTRRVQDPLPQLCRRRLTGDERQTGRGVAQGGELIAAALALGQMLLEARTLVGVENVEGVEG